MDADRAARQIVQHSGVVSIGYPPFGARGAIAGNALFPNLTVLRQ